MAAESSAVAGMRKAPSIEWRWVSAGEEEDDKLEGPRLSGRREGAAASSPRTRRTTSTTRTRTRSTGRPGNSCHARPPPNCLAATPIRWWRSLCLQPMTMNHAFFMEQTILDRSS
ncbi:hypothetical protein ACQJBY_068032 [Aegilops geniculata]